MLKLRSKKQNTLPGRALLLLTQPSVALLAIMLVLMQWRIPTAVQITVTYDARKIEHSDDAVAAIKSGDFSLSDAKTLYLQYPDFPKVRPVTITHIREIDITPAGELNIEELEMDMARHERQFKLTGTIETFRVRTTTTTRDIRLTRFDQFVRSPKIMLGGLAFWIALTGLGWFKAYREL